MWERTLVAMLNLFLSERLDPSKALVSSIAAPVPIRLRDFVFGDKFPASIFLGDGIGGISSRSGNAAYDLKVSLGSKDSVPTYGTFTITFDGQTTTAIDFDATADDVQAALELLANIGDGNVIVTGNAPAWQIEFIGDEAETSQPLFTVNAERLFPDSVATISRIQSGTSGTNEEQFIFLRCAQTTNTAWTIISDPPTGYFTISHGGSTTAMIPYAATAATVLAALEDLASIGDGNISVTGSSPTWTITFIGDLELSARAAVTIGTQLLIPQATATVTVIEAGDASNNAQQTIGIADPPSGWTGNIELKSPQLYALFDGQTAVEVTLHVQLIDADDNAETIAAVPFNMLLPIGLQSGSSTPSQNSSAAITLPLIDGQNNVSITENIVIVSNRNWSVAPRAVMVSIHAPTGSGPIFASTFNDSITANLFIFGMGGLPENDDYTFTYVPIF